MNAKQQLNRKVKNLLQKGERLDLPKSVIITFQRYCGYNYRTQEQEYVPAKAVLTYIARTDKVGNVVLGDEYDVNEWRINELRDDECRRILDVIEECVKQ